MPHDQLKSLVLRLLSDKDHEKIFDVVTKVEKHYRQKSRDGVTMTSCDRGNRGRNPRDSARNCSAGCYYCGKPGHFKVNCHQRKRDLVVEEKNGASQPPRKS